MRLLVRLAFILSITLFHIQEIGTGQLSTGKQISINRLLDEEHDIPSGLKFCFRYSIVSADFYNR